MFHRCIESLMASKRNESLVEQQRKLAGRGLISYSDGKDIAGGPMQDTVCG